MTPPSLLRSVVTAGLLGLALTGCGKDSAKSSSPSTPAAGGATSDQVLVKDFAFKPEAITVKVGAKVTWTFKDDSNHNVESVGPSELTKSPDLKDGGTYAFTFTKAGKVSYRCGIHNYMTGSVMVTA